MKRKKKRKTPSRVMRINSFNGGYRYLSNFYEDAPVMLDGLHFRNSEAAYQAGKAATLSVRKLFVDLIPDEARKLGRAITIREDWLDVRADYMRQVVHAKFTQNPMLAEALIATGAAELEEGNHWHDNFFGNCYCPACRKIPGQNMLGKILMEERGRLTEAGRDSQ